MDGKYLGTLFSQSIATLNGSREITFECSSFNKSTDYRFVLIEPAIKYDCRSDEFRIVPCGNGVLDPEEQCDYNLDPIRCSKKCQCLAQYYPITLSNGSADGCCDSNCQTNSNINPENGTDFSGTRIVIGGTLHILNNYTVYIDKNTTIKTSCIDNNGIISLNGSDFKSGDTFTPIISNCSIKPSITITNIPKCLLVTQNHISESGIGNLLKIEFSSDSISTGCVSNSTVTSPSKTNYILLVIIISVISLIVIVLIFLSIFNDSFKKKVFPWRHKKESHDISSADEIYLDTLSPSSSSI